LYSIEDGTLCGIQQDRKTFRTGLAFQIPEHHVMLVYSRSGHGFKHGITLINKTGVVDSDYRGEVFVGLQINKAGQYHVKKGERVAQAMVIPVHRYTLEMVDHLDSTDRGTGGFGSTGLS
jgi:dUTP pyrophosphatase